MSAIRNVYALDTGLSHLERFSPLDHYQDLFDPKSQKKF